MAEGRTLAPVTRDELRAFLEETSGPAVSLYQPAARAGKEAEGNPLRFKNLLAHTEERLDGTGLDRHRAQALLEPLRALLSDADFWSRPQDGLAVLATPTQLRTFWLGYPVPEKAVVGSNPYVVPLLPALTGNQLFFILALSMASVRLLRASLHGCEEIDLSGVDMPHSLAEALRYDDFEKTELQHHPSAHAGVGGGRHIFHGHGPGSEDHKEEIARYFHGVAGGLRDLLGSDRAPVVIAAVDYLHPLFKSASGFRNILEPGIEGNPDPLSAKELHRRALPMVKAHLEANLRDLIERCGSLQGSGRASDDLTHVLEAAHQGRIEALIVKEGAEVHGSFTPGDGKAEIHDEARPGDEDLIDLAVRQTLLHSGEAYLVEPGLMPAGTDVCALFRF
jgi:hypothetical protein